MALTSGLGTFLRSARNAKGLTLRAVEEAAGVSNAYLSQLESGKIARPSPATLHKLCLLYEASYVQAMQLAGHPLPAESEEQESAVHHRLSSRLGQITSAEEDALAEYLEFLRSRSQGRR